MVTGSDALDRVFGALSDPIRRAILAHLAHGDTTVGELAAPFTISRPAISKHLRVLEAAGLVRRTREGRVSRLQYDGRPIQDVAEWLEAYRAFWGGQLDALSRYLESTIPAADAAGHKENVE